MEREVEWTSSKKCDFCGTEIDDILIDGRTKTGPWATMCSKCFKHYGTGIFGTGFGQKYKKNSEGRFLKIEG